MLRIDHQRAPSREAEPGADRGFSESQRSNPVRRRKSPARLRLGGAGSAPAAVPKTRPRGAGFVAALPGEDDRPDPGPGDAARAVLRLLYTIAAVPKPGGSILYGDGLEGFGDGLFQDLGSASFGGAEQLLQLRPGLLDRIEIG